MTVYIFEGGEIIERRNRRHVVVAKSDLPAPMIGARMEPFESPVTGQEISSWRARDRDMAAAGAVDPRDLPTPTKGRAAKKRELKNARQRNHSADERRSRP